MQLFDQVPTDGTVDGRIRIRRGATRCECGGQGKGGGPGIGTGALGPLVSLAAGRFIPDYKACPVACSL